MKKCPTCKMTVDADNECPFCYTTITYEPVVFCDKETHVWNKYFVRYWIKRCWFSLLCFVIVLLRWIFVKAALPYAFLLPLLLAGLSLLLSILERKVASGMQWKYSEGYSAFKAVWGKVLFGALAVLLAFVIH